MYSMKMLGEKLKYFKLLISQINFHQIMKDI